jgi:hypothetical protein
VGVLKRTRVTPDGGVAISGVVRGAAPRATGVPAAGVIPTPTFILKLLLPR